MNYDHIRMPDNVRWWKAEQMSSYGDATCYIRALLTKF
uniref:Uncharacterized protein n=1 Tax=Anguilla anguilla TaxID=7936 RepID=A0A0E9SMA1_ANGAN